MGRTRSAGGLGSDLVLSRGRGIEGRPGAARSPALTATWAVVAPAAPVPLATSAKALTVVAVETVASYACTCPSRALRIGSHAGRGCEGVTCTRGQPSVDADRE